MKWICCCAQCKRYDDDALHTESKKKSNRRFSFAEIKMYVNVCNALWGKIQRHRPVNIGLHVWNRNCANTHTARILGTKWEKSESDQMYRKANLATMVNIWFWSWAWSIAWHIHFKTYKYKRETCTDTHNRQIYNMLCKEEKKKQHRRSVGRVYILYIYYSKSKQIQW